MRSRLLVSAFIARLFCGTRPRVVGLLRNP